MKQRHRRLKMIVFLLKYKVTLSNKSRLKDLDE